jgi:hypothetical protein
MTKVEAKKLALGLYRLFWKSGGSSLAAIGRGANGDRWLAPVNWVEVGFADSWRLVSRVELIESLQKVECKEEGHICPYAADIHGDYTTLCHCDKEATRQCAADI